MPGTHSAVSPTETEFALLADAAVEELARDLARRASGRPANPEPGPGQAQDEQQGSGLLYLHMLMHVGRAVERQIDRAAVKAAGAGAGYPQLGKACDITRQGARRRWPGLVTSATRSRLHPRRGR